MIFRIDDVTINTPPAKLKQIIDLILRYYPSAEIWNAVALCVADMSSDPKPDRMNPSIWNCHSDHRIFYTMNKIGVPDLTDIPGKVVSHGFVHVDHRLLHRSLQEWNIIASCSILSTDTFVPPYNKWNDDTEQICNNNSIKLAKWEDGWNHLVYKPVRGMNYLHTYDMTIEQLEDKLAK